MKQSETPIRRQYLEIKAKHQNAILLFRIGDFYEAFDDDARLIASELDIVLTSKAMGNSERVPLAGVPHFVLEKHLATLIARGHRVAICEQTSDSPVKGDDGKKLIQRDVVRIVTAGTVIEPALLEGKSNNYLAAFCTDGQRSGIAFADITTGDFATTEVENARALTELQRLAPAEIVLADNDQSIEKQNIPAFVSLLDAKNFAFETAKKNILRHFNAKSLQPFGLAESSLAVSAAGALISYLEQTQTGVAEQLTRLNKYETGDYLLIDAKTLQSLEIFESASGASLWSFLDRTKTAMGGRLLRRWLRSPLLETAEIYRRQNYVAWFIEQKNERVKLQEILSNLKDLERLSGRAKAQQISPYELLALINSLEKIPAIKSILQADANRFSKLLVEMPDCKKLVELLSSALSEDLPARITEQNYVIREGFSAELDKLRVALRDGKNYLADIEKRERERTGIKSLRVGYNKVFGYYIEVTKSNLHLVPADFVRKQTLLPAERFVTLELKEYESIVVNARERIGELETSLFRQICQEVGKFRREILLAASTIAFLDAILALAEVAEENDYTRPTVNETSLLRIKNGRHPVVENILKKSDEQFVGNDAALGGNGAPQIALITGPNASGKSTFLRQVALITILAQVGSFVPADEAVIGVCDRIFTRIGLYDKIGSGESTFMTEMIETAEILHNANQRSLILLDELGRGTSTFDGLAVARSVLEFLHNHPKLQSRTLFATHYHELAELEALLARVKNYQVEIAEADDEIVFKYKISPGNAQKSYGVYAAKIAGLPAPVIRRAEQLLREYESEKFVAINTQKNSGDNLLVNKLSEIDADTLSPVEALMLVFELKNIANKSFSSENKPRWRKASGE